MRVVCWNKSLIIRADNEPDALWLTEFVRDLESGNVFSGHIELEVGEFHSDESLEVYKHYMDLTTFKKNVEGEYVFVEMNSEDHSGHEGHVVGLKFSYLNNWTNPGWKKLLEKELKSLNKP